MQITEVRIYPTNEALVRAYVTIVFDNCLLIREIRVIKSSTGYFVAMPANKQPDGTHWDIAYPANDEARNMMQRGHTGGVREDGCGQRLNAKRQRKIMYDATRKLTF